MFRLPNARKRSQRAPPAIPRRRQRLTRQGVTSREERCDCEGGEGGKRCATPATRYALSRLLISRCSPLSLSLCLAAFLTQPAHIAVHEIFCRITRSYVSRCGCYRRPHRRPVRELGKILRHPLAPASIRPLIILESLAAPGPTALNPIHESAANLRFPLLASRCSACWLLLSGVSHRTLAPRRRPLITLLLLHRPPPLRPAPRSASTAPSDLPRSARDNSAVDESA